MNRRIAHAAQVVALVLALALVPAALAGKGGNGGSTGSTSGCTQSAPRASIDNTWAWGTPGSWGLPGQQLKYAIDVFNNDVGCGSSSFVVKMSAPSGFSVSMPSSTITLNSASSAYVWANVTSPAGAADGDYPLTDITFSVDSQVDGGTASTMDCVDSGSNSVASGSTDGNGDGSVTASDLEPGTYVCTVVIDP